VRRDRTYELALIAAGAPTRLLTRMRFRGKTVPSQTVYRVAPGGRWLAFRESDRLRLLDAAAHEWELAPAFEDFRFSADGRWLAVATRTSSDDTGRYDERRAGELVFVELGGKAPVARRRFALSGMQRIEWSAAGVVVHHVRLPQGGLVEDELMLVPLDGEPRSIYHGSFDRFTSAARGARVLVFTSNQILDFDLAHPDAPAKRSPGEYVIENVEMAADGSAALFVGWTRYGPSAAFLLGREGPVRKLFSGTVSSVWSADDGARFVWRAADGVHLGERDFPVVQPAASLYASLPSVRFRRDAPGLIAVREKQVVAWDADGKNEKVLWQPKDPAAQLLGADHFAGGLVVWQESESDEQSYEDRLRFVE
jgi:hypothetical protein